MTNLPNAVYATSSMTTSGKTLVIASTGTAVGQYTRPSTYILGVSNTLQTVSFPLPGTSALPDAAYSTALMTTSGKTLVVASSGSSWGRYARVNSLVLQVAVSQTVPASNTEAPATSESASVRIAYNYSASNTEAPATSEAATLVKQKFTASDTEAPATSESAALKQKFTVSNTAAAAITEAAFISKQKNTASDTAALAVAESVILNTTGGGAAADIFITAAGVETMQYPEASAGGNGIRISAAHVEWSNHPTNKIEVTALAVEATDHALLNVLATQVCVEVVLANPAGSPTHTKRNHSFVAGAQYFGLGKGKNASFSGTV